MGPRSNIPNNTDGSHRDKKSMEEAEVAVTAKEEAELWARICNHVAQEVAAYEQCCSNSSVEG